MEEKKETWWNKARTVRIPAFLVKLLIAAVLLGVLHLGILWAGHAIVILPTAEFNASFLR